MDISNYEDTYVITRDGQVFNKKTGRGIKLAVDNSGYLCFTACKNYGRKILRIHRLLALLFIPNPYNYECVDHIDRNRLNNSIENLRWVSKQQNMFNRSMQSNNSSGAIGVSYSKRDNKWVAQIQKTGKVVAKKFEYNDEGFQQGTLWYLEQKNKLHTFE